MYQQDLGMGFGGDIYGNQQQHHSTSVDGMGRDGEHKANQRVGTKVSGCLFFFVTPFLNCITFGLSVAGAVGPQMQITGMTSAESRASILNRETSSYFSPSVYYIFFTHYSDRSSRFASSLDLPACIAGKYRAGYAFAVIGCLFVVANFMGCCFGCYKSCQDSIYVPKFRFMQTIIALGACVCMLIAFSISKSGFNSCDGTFEDFRTDSGGSSLVAAFVFTLLVAGLTAARELLWPDIPKPVSTHARHLEKQIELNNAQDHFMTSQSAGHVQPNLLFQSNDTYQQQPVTTTMMGHRDMFQQQLQPPQQQTANGFGI